MDLFRKIFSAKPQVDYKQLIAEGAVVLDVRTPQEYSAGHTEGSISMPLAVVPVRMDELKDKKKPVIVVCQSGMRASQAKGLLERAGFEEVYNAGNWQSVL